MNEPTIEIHREKPPFFEGDADNVGYLRASNDVAAVTLAVSHALLDDPKLVDHYIKNRLLWFLEIETKRVGEPDSPQAN